MTEAKRTTEKLKMHIRISRIPEDDSCHRRKRIRYKNPGINNKRVKLMCTAHSIFKKSSVIVPEIGIFLKIVFLFRS